MRGRGIREVEQDGDPAYHTDPKLQLVPASDYAAQLKLWFRDVYTWAISNEQEAAEAGLSEHPQGLAR